MAPHATDTFIENRDTTHSFTSRNALGDPDLDLPSPLEDGDLVEPIAVIGFSFKFPQEADSTDSFWKLLMEKRSTATEFPQDRLSVSAFYHPDASRGSTLPFHGGHFIKSDVAAFDAPFFSISASEAASLDPQQRGLLETTYKAIENSGLPMESVLGSKTSVFTGCFTNDWQQLSLKDSEHSSTHTALGIEASMNANRISWFFDFKGTSFNVDSACSSSLVTLDLACTSLITQDADMSIATGCNLILYPDLMRVLSNMYMLSPDNQCFAFDSRANGYARGEGFGVVVLKRLTDALRDNDNIRAVVRSTGSNQDGHTAGITQPSADAQAALIRETYRKAGLTMNKTRYFEAHGTGTAIGDPTEAHALGEVFRHTRAPDDPLIVGAIKSNIGHLEGASGIAGIIKTILTLERAVIPPNANFRSINPKIDADSLRIKFPLEPTPWPSKGLRRASVNSFGYGGTNAHAILDDAFHYLRDHGLVGNHSTVPNPPLAEVLRRSLSSISPAVGDSDCNPEAAFPKLLVLSAFNERALTRLAAQYTKKFADVPMLFSSFDSYLDNLAYTINTRRSLLPWKSYLIARSSRDLLQFDSKISSGRRPISNPLLGFIFTGQGAQWAGMGRDLRVFDVFEQKLREAEKYLIQLGCPWHLCEELLRPQDHTNINKPDFSQPISTAIQVALVDLLRSFGIVATTVIGHSSGEIASAYCLGAISAKSAWRLAYNRGKFSASLARTGRHNGAMISVGLSEAHVQPYLDQITDESGACRLAIACINSHKNVTLSGDADQIDMLAHKLASEDIFARKLIVEVAYHSYHMQAIAQDYGLSIRNLEKGSFLSDVIMISSVTGQRVDGNELCTSEYWVKNMVSPVQFSSAIRQLCIGTAKNNRKKLDGSHKNHPQVNVLLEIGPHAALQGPIRDTLAEIPGAAKFNYIPVLIRRRSSLQCLLDFCGQLHCLGYFFDLSKVNRFNTQLSNNPKPLHNLPEYPFDHSHKYWDESRISRRYRLHDQKKLDLLGRPVPDWNPLEAKWRNVIRTSEMSWVADHMINGRVIYPAAGMLVMAIEAANQMVDSTRTVTGFEFKDVLFQKALSIPQDSEDVETSFHLRRKNNISENTASWLDFRLCSLEKDDWSENCRGSIRVKYEAIPGAVDRGRETSEELSLYRRIDDRLSSSCTDVFDSSQLYAMLKQCGFGFGPAFQSLKNGSWNSMNQAKSDIILYQWPTNEYPQQHVVHPTTLDGILHLSFAALSCGGRKPMPTSIPTQLRKMWIAKSGLSYPENTTAKAAAWMNDINDRSVDFDISVLDESKAHILARVEGLRCTKVADLAEQSLGGLPEKQVCYHLEMKPDVGFLDKKQLSAFCAEARYQHPEPIQFYQNLTFCLFVFLSRLVETVDGSQVKQPHLQRYFQWAKLQLHRYENGELPHSKPEWRLLLQESELVESICGSVASTNDQGRVFIATGRSLTNILRGEIDPLDFFFKSSLLKDLYSEINGSRTCFSEFVRYLDALGYKNPNMKILEVGAGTGGTTARILSALSVQQIGERLEQRYSSYHYTDISPSFFEKARAEFHQYPNITYSILDITSDPCEQGFAAEDYDLIIAANVLHATENINDTMKHLRKLLNSEGKLMMYEVTRPDILRTGFVAGLLSGWWVGVESHRQSSPLLSCESWEKVLCDNGFSGIDLELPDFVSDECQEGSILVTTAMSFTLEEAGCSNVVVIADLSSSLQVDVADKLKSALLSEEHISCDIRCFDAAVSIKDKSSVRFILLEELERPLLSDSSAEKYLAIRELLTSSNSVLWITGSGGQYSKGPEYAIINGLSRVLRNENPKRAIATLALDIQREITEKQLQWICHVFRVFQLEHESSQHDSEFIEIDGFLSVPRVVRDSGLSQELFTRSLTHQSRMRILRDAPPMKLAVASPGLLDTLCFVDDEDYRRPLAPDEVEIEVRTIGMNFKDCLTALGQIPGSSFGTECAGVVTRVGKDCAFLAGDRVMMAATETFKTFSRAKDHLVHKIHDEMTFLEAASIPTQFGTAWQAIHELAHLKRGETILIHAGAGGTGQAAVQISQYLGAEIFVTVGSEMKKELLIREYGISEDHVFDSRDTSFAKGIMRVTGNKGVDVVINSLSGEGLIASWECIAPYGRFIEIGKKDILANSSLPMYRFEKNTSFICFDGFVWQRERPLQAKETFRTLLNLFAQRRLHAARPLHAYDISQLEEVFRLMQDGNMAGKIVLQVSPDAQVPTKFATKPSFRIDNNGTYLIAGGLGGLGRSIARWLANRGAKNLILLSRSGAKSDAALKFLEELKRQDITVATPACDVTVASSLQTVLKQCAKDMPPIRGCIQGSMVLRDAVFDTMSHSDWCIGTECKTIGSWNLHTLLPRDLDFFIMLSSASGIVGLRGQANYAAGNTYMDALARYRIAHGERAVSLDLGALTDDGLLAETPDLLNRVLAYGALNPISREQCFAILDYYCDPALPPLTPCLSQPIIGLGTGAGPSLEGLALSRQSIFRHVQVHKGDAGLVASNASSDKSEDFKQAFSLTTSVDEARAVVSQALIKKLSQNLSTLEGDIDLHRPLASYGVDSLLAVELRSWIAKTFLADVAAFEISGDSTFSTASQLMASRSTLKHDAWKL